jgi:glycosyltransferase involved in cell wall biosynthesis
MPVTVERPRRQPHLLHVFPTFVPAGSQLRTTALMHEYGDEFRHSVIALDGRTSAAGTAGSGIALRCIDPPPKGGSLFTALRLRRLLQSERPDLLLTYGFGSIDAILAARALGMRGIVHHEDGFGPDETQVLKRRRVLFRRLALPWCRRVVVVSENLHKIATERWRLDPALVSFIPNGIRVERFEPADRNPALRRELGLGQDEIVVGAVGHLRAEKNFARLLRAVAASRGNPVVLLVGEGRERERLVADAVHLGLRDRIRLVGHVADPRPLYRMMDVFALSSDTEQMPLVLLEAMASALPIVATDVGDVSRMVPQSQRPYIVDVCVQDTDARMAAAISALAASELLRHALGAENRRYVRERFPFERMLEAHRGHITDALSLDGNGRAV